MATWDQRRTAAARNQRPGRPASRCGLSTSPRSGFFCSFYFPVTRGGVGTGTGAVTRRDCQWKRVRYRLRKPREGAHRHDDAWAHVAASIPEGSPSCFTAQRKPLLPPEVPKYNAWGFFCDVSRLFLQSPLSGTPRGRARVAVGAQAALPTPVPPRPRAPAPYQAVVGVQAAVAAGLGEVRRVAQHAPVAGLVHPAGGAPRVAAVMAICKRGGHRRDCPKAGNPPKAPVVSCCRL